MAADFSHLLHHWHYHDRLCTFPIYLHHYHDRLWSDRHPIWPLSCRHGAVVQESDDNWQSDDLSSSDWPSTSLTIEKSRHTRLGGRYWLKWPCKPSAVGFEMQHAYVSILHLDIEISYWELCIKVDIVSTLINLNTFVPNSHFFTSFLKRESTCQTHRLFDS